MDYKLKVPATVSTLIKNLHPKIKKKIRYGINEIVSDPYSGKLLKHELEGLQSYRIGKYRIIYRKTSKIIELIAIGPRKNIYAETLKLISGERKNRR